jgi:hypothetical protein
MRVRDSLEPADISRHLDTFPLTLFASPAQNKLAGLAEWERVKSSKAETDIEEFANRFPASVYSPFARLRAARLKAFKSGSYKPVISGSLERVIDEKELEPLSCNQLWMARNEIYYGLGYCFTTVDATNAFQTDKDCPYSDCRRIDKYNALVNDQIISRTQDRNVRMIRDAEARRDCRQSQVKNACAAKP